MAGPHHRAGKAVSRKKHKQRDSKPASPEPTKQHTATQTKLASHSATAGYQSDARHTQQSRDTSHSSPLMNPMQSTASQTNMAFHSPNGNAEDSDHRQPLQDSMHAATPPCYTSPQDNMASYAFDTNSHTGFTQQQYNGNFMDASGGATAPYFGAQQANMASYPLTGPATAESVRLQYYRDSVHSEQTMTPGYLSSASNMVPYFTPSIKHLSENHFTDRLDNLERQLRQTNLSAQVCEMQYPGCFNNLQHEVTQIKHAIVQNIPSLRHRISTLELQLDNQAATIRQTIEESVKARSQEEKLQSAMRNANLRRISDGTCLPPGLSKTREYARKIAQLESLAETLRERTHIGGRVYVEEAQDAEALALKLREDAGVPKSDLMERLHEGHDATGESNKMHRLDEHRNAITEDNASVAGSTDSTMVIFAKLKEDTAVQTTRSNETKLYAPISTPPSPDPTPRSTPQPPALRSWQPSCIAALPAIPATELEDVPSPENMITFSRTFLLSKLEGEKWSPGFYHTPASKRSLLPNRGFFLLDSSIEPLAPTSPGSHGSVITPVYRIPSGDASDPKPQAMQNAPLFSSRPGAKPGQDYVYMGMYSLAAAPNRLDVERAAQVVPEDIKQYWAAQLCAPERPDWVTSALKSHLSPPPTYTGPYADTDADQELAPALQRFSNEISAWHRDASVRTSFLGAGAIRAAFESPDAADVPGIRFWCMPLGCQGWDADFYAMMCREKKGEKEEKRQKQRMGDLFENLGPRRVKEDKW